MYIFLITIKDFDSFGPKFCIVGSRHFNELFCDHSKNGWLFDGFGVHKLVLDFFIATKNEKLIALKYFVALETIIYSLNKS